MPDPDTSPSFHPSESQIQETSRRHDGSHAISDLKLYKRIVMNPPPSFIQYLASIQPSAPQANGPMMINSNGQAVLIGPNGVQPASNVPYTSEPVVNAQNPPPEQASQVQPADEKEPDNGQVVLKGDKVVLVAPTETPTSTPTFSPSATEVISSVVAGTPAPSSAITPIPSSTVTSSTTTEASSTTSDTMTSNPASTTPSSTAQVSTTSNVSSTSTIPSSSSSPSASQSSSTSSAHHPASAGIIFLIILLSLAIFVALISLLRYLVKSRRLKLPCMRRSRDDDDDDGLSDLVRGFDTPRTLGGGGYNPYLHAASYPHLQEEEQEKSELERRSSLFAHQGKSPFLHSQSSPEATQVGYGYDVHIPNLPVPPPLALGGSGETQREESTLPHHLLGKTGPLEVRNALPGEVDSDERHTEREAKGIDGLVGLGLGQGSPRFLGVNGNGLPVPWSTPLPPRPSSIDSFDNHQPNPNPFGSSSTLSASAIPGSVPLKGVAPPLGFPSPSLSHDSLSLPQRSATWASNLRNTLYNAISAARAPTLGGTGGGVNPIDEDKFTRTVTVGNIYRNSSRRKAIPVFDLEKGLEGGLKVVDEKDDPELKRPAALDRLTSDSSNDSESTLVIPRRPGGAGERFKGYYARSKSSTNVSSTGEDEEVDQIRPSRMAGGARAAGARTGSFVIV
ncbi:hypothetical protein I302_107791 [Kwoniella bestiolae CBS 10118]|uniref:Uncharacterized protein n=1 Tax=Kwoniella bestiolae CBS 10118 TaxID=1296100 RepID=A0A1B9FXI0_9TREE|nr:hypothetical protein I302_06471 [Kwoniella bestiolae CBS 10118]OCF23488.1 hypothetical protein I302_06471 [Kwoniella bestiolae CBS 10118]